MMAAVPPWRRGIASGTRTMLQNTGPVISIALMLMIVTAVVPTTLLFSIFSGLTTGLSPDRLDPFMEGMQLALWILVAFSLPGAAVSALRGRHAAVARSGEPLGAERYRVQFTIGTATHEKLRRAQELLRREIPDGAIPAQSSTAP